MILSALTYSIMRGNLTVTKLLVEKYDLLSTICIRRIVLRDDVLSEESVVSSEEASLIALDAILTLKLALDS